jgi:hypothetical protein
VKIDATMIVYCSFFSILNLCWVKIPHPGESSDWVIWMEKNSEYALQARCALRSSSVGGTELRTQKEPRRNQGDS